MSVQDAGAAYRFPPRKMARSLPQGNVKKRPRVTYGEEARADQRLSRKNSPSTSASSSSSILASTSSSSFANGKTVGEVKKGQEEDSYRKGMFLSFVRKALTDRQLGISDTYNDLLSQISPAQPIASSSTSGPPQPLLPHTILPFLVALTSSVSFITQTHSTLISAVIALPWSASDSEVFVRTYTNFISILCVAKPEWCSAVCEKTVEGMTFQSGLKPFTSTPQSSSTDSSPVRTVTRRQMYDRLHGLLAELVRLIPTFPSILLPVLLRNFPHKRQPEIHHVTFIRNALRITEWCDGLSERILQAVVDRAIQIDVEIQVELDEIEDEDEDDDDDADNDDEVAAISNAIDIFDRFLSDDSPEPDLAQSLDSDNSSDISEDEDDLMNELSDDEKESEAERKKKIQLVKEMSSKLDAILNVVFEHFNKINSSFDTIISPSIQTRTGSTSPRSRNSQDEESVTRGQTLRSNQFHSLLSIFSQVILPTFKCRHVQFLVFWYASLDPNYTDELQGLLVSRALLETSASEVTRIAAASYIASFVSRARWVEGESVRAVMKLLCGYLEITLDRIKEDPSLLKPLLSTYGNASGLRHGGFGLFFAVAQAVFLIFCFRWKDLIMGEDGEEEDFFDGMDMMDGGINSQPFWKEDRKWAPGLEILEKVITSPFNPLKVCSPNVVKQFARVAHNTSFLYCYSIIQVNNRQASSTTNNSQTSLPLSSTVLKPTDFQQSQPQSQLPKPNSHARDLSSEDADLDSFFPFDPYQLEKSGKYIERIYRAWEAPEGWPDEDDEDEDEDEDGDEDGDEDETGDTLEGFIIPFSKRPVKGLKNSLEDEMSYSLGKSLEGMSISPAGGFSARMNKRLGVVSS